MDCDILVITFVSIEQSDLCGCAWGIVIGKLHEGEESEPVVLLVVAVDPDVLLQGLISALSPPVTFQVIS